MSVVLGTIPSNITLTPLRQSASTLRRGVISATCCYNILPWRMQLWTMSFCLNLSLDCLNNSHTISVRRQTSIPIMNVYLTIFITWTSITSTIFQLSFHLFLNSNYNYDFLLGLCAPTFVLAVTTFTASIGSVTSLKLTTGLADTVNVTSILISEFFLVWNISIHICVFFFNCVLQKFSVPEWASSLHWER